MSVKRYNGSTWDTYAGNNNLTSTLFLWKKTSVGGETSLTGSDDNAVTLAYTVNQESVYVNGVLQVRNVDYTASNGSSITLTIPLVVGNTVQVISPLTFAIANLYTMGQIDAFIANDQALSLMLSGI